MRVSAQITLCVSSPWLVCCLQSWSWTTRFPIQWRRSSRPLCFVWQWCTEDSLSRIHGSENTGLACSTWLEIGIKSKIFSKTPTCGMRPKIVALKMDLWVMQWISSGKPLGWWSPAAFFVNIFALICFGLRSGAFCDVLREKWEQRRKFGTLPSPVAEIDKTDIISRTLHPAFERKLADIMGRILQPWLSPKSFTNSQGSMCYISGSVPLLELLCSATDAASTENAWDWHGTMQRFREKATLQKLDSEVAQIARSVWKAEEGRSMVVSFQARDAAGVEQLKSMWKEAQDRCVYLETALQTQFQILCIDRWIEEVLHDVLLFFGYSIICFTKTLSLCRICPRTVAWELQRSRSRCSTSRAHWSSWRPLSISIRVWNRWRSFESV